MTYSIPLFDLDFDAEEEAAVLEVLRSRWISTGPRTAELEDAFASALQVQHAVAVANCTSALHLALLLVGVGPGDDVICPSLAFVATANAIRYVGATPVFCDITSTANLNLDPRGIEAALTPRTTAITVMHYGGFPCDMDAIQCIARRHELKVVEDACHGPMSEYRGQKLGTIGDIGCFSFFANKNISTGEGGMLVTNNAEHARRARLLRSHGVTSSSHERAAGHATSYDVVELGYNYRIDDLRSALGIVQLRKLPGDLERRARVRRRYLAALADCPRLTVPFADHCGPVSNYIFPVVLNASSVVTRDRVREALRRSGVQTSVHYPAVHRFRTYSPGPHLAITEYVSDNLISLPMFGRMTDADVDHVCAELVKAL